MAGFVLNPGSWFLDLYSLFFALYFYKISKFDVCHPIILFAKSRNQHC